MPLTLTSLQVLSRQSAGNRLKQVLSQRDDGESHLVGPCPKSVVLEAAYLKVARAQGLVAAASPGYGLEACW